MGVHVPARVHNRLDGTIIFRALSREEITQIVDLLLNLMQERLKEQRIEPGGSRRQTA